MSTDVASGKKTLDELHAFARNDFATFLALAFQALHPGKVLKWAPYIEVMCKALQDVYLGKCTRLLINLPPRMLKTFSCSVAFSAWLHGKNPYYKLIAASYGESLATQISGDCRRLMQSDMYKAVFPHVTVGSFKNTIEQFDVNSLGHRFATTIGGAMAGWGADFIFIDDPEKPTDVTSQKARDDVKEWFASTVVPRLNEGGTGAIIVITHRLHEDDFSSHLISRSTWTHIKFPMIAEEDIEYQISDSETCIFKRGELLHPERFGQDVIARLRHEIGSRVFESHYLQNPLPAGGGLVNWAHFGNYDKAPQYEEFEYVFQSWDPASTTKEHSDYSACITCGLKGDQIYILDVHRYKYELGDLPNRVRELDAKYRPHMIIIESFGPGSTAVHLLGAANFHPLCHVAPLKSKKFRLDLVTPMIERGEVLIPKIAAWLAEFRNEMKSFPNGLHDDQVDAFSQLLAHLDFMKLQAKLQAGSVNRPYAPRAKAHATLSARVYSVGGGIIRDHYAERMSDW